MDAARRGEPDDRVLVARTLAGDPAGFDALVARYERPVYNLAHRLIGNHHDAQEATQQSFLRAYLALPRFKRQAAFYSWLYRITTNVCLDELRRRKRAPIVVPADALGGCEEPRRVIAESDTRQVVHEALRVLRADHRSIIILRDVLGLSYRQIAATLGIPVGTLKSRLNRARRALRERLEASGVAAGTA